MSKALLFFYGTLQTGTGIRRVDRLLARCTRDVGRAWISGRLYDLGRYPAAVASAGHNARIHGRVVELRQAQRWLKVLDDYEGVTPLCASDGEYVRTQITAYLPAGRRVLNCWAYFYRQSPRWARRIRTGSYVGRVPN